MARTVAQTIIAFMDRNYTVGNGMMTTATHETVDVGLDGAIINGLLQLKWWKANGELIIKEAHLLPRGSNVVTYACKDVLAARDLRWNLHHIKLESVMNPTLIQKLCERGWKQSADGDGNLYLLPG